MTNLLRLSVLLLAVGLALTAARAAEKATTVVELFTSQGCSSCPPADANLGRLAARDDIVALGFHVDYWDDLVYGGAGRWKDVFSDPAFTARQRDYNRAIRGSGQVYTPQMIIDGRIETVGFKRTEVHRAIRTAQTEATKSIGIDVRPREGGGLVIRLVGGTAF